MEEKKKQYFIRCVGTNPDDISIDVRISGIYELSNIVFSELQEVLLSKLKEINENVVMCDITNMNNIN